MKTHHITQISQITDIVNSENVENFLIDFEIAVKTAIEMREDGKMLMGRQDVNSLKDGFVWVDNGENTAGIKTKPFNTGN